MSRPLQPFSNRGEPARGSSLHTIKTQQKAKEEEERIRLKRRKGIVTLMLHFCQEMGYARSLDALQSDSGLTLGKSTVAADNIDLATVVTEYEDYYEYRFGRKPRLYRAPTEGEAAAGGEGLLFEGGEGMLKKPTAGRRAGANGGGGGISTPPPSAPSSSLGVGYGGIVQPPATAPVAPSGGGGRPTAGATDGNAAGRKGGADNGSSAAAGGGASAGLAGMAIGGNAIKVTAAPGGGIDDHFKNNNKNSNNNNGGDDDDEDDLGVFAGGRALKPMPRFLTQDLAELAGTIQRDILDANPNVRFDHIAELTVAKDLLKEAVVMPVKYPSLFAGLLRPWKGVLLYGPPGTGKTMLAKAVATECRTTFFNISASSIVSKWRGDSEKLVRMLFDLAVHYAPSTIFIDELDSILSARSSDGSEHEGSRRMKTELLIQIDGLSKRRNGDVVFVLGASNVPWDLDPAILRRLEKRILVTLPSEAARADMIRANLTANTGAGGGGRRRGGGGGGGPSFNASPSLPSSPPSEPNAAASPVTASSAAPLPTPPQPSTASSAVGCPLTEAELSQAAKATEGYSGADIDIVCREATMRTIRALIAKLERMEKEQKEQRGGGGGGAASASAAAMAATVQRPQVTMADVMAAVKATNPSTHPSDLDKYAQWAENFGSTMS